MWLDVLSGSDYKLSNPGGNYVTSGYPSRAATITPPDQVTSGVVAKGDGVIKCGHEGVETAGHIIMVPIGVGVATNTFSLKVLGWRSTKLNVANAKPLWIPVELATYAVVLGTAAGVTGADLTASTLLATTITSTGGPTFITSGAVPVSLDWMQISPGSNAVGCIKQPTLGFRFLEIIFTTGGVATSCNTLWCRG